MREPSDPVELSRVNAELAFVTAPQRLGFVFAGVGVLLAILRGTALPGLPRGVPVAFVLTALGLVVIGTIRRVRWHRRRTRRVRDH